VCAQDFLLKEFEHPIDYDLEAALPRLKTWGLVRENHQVRARARVAAPWCGMRGRVWRSARARM
jgi:hypothetical protein